MSFSHRPAHNQVGSFSGLSSLSCDDPRVPASEKPVDVIVIDDVTLGVYDLAPFHDLASRLQRGANEKTLKQIVCQKDIWNVLTAKRRNDHEEYLNTAIQGLIGMNLEWATTDTDVTVSENTLLIATQGAHSSMILAFSPSQEIDPAIYETMSEDPDVLDLSQSGSDETSTDATGKPMAGHFHIFSNHFQHDLKLLRSDRQQGLELDTGDHPIGQIDLADYAGGGSVISYAIAKDRERDLPFDAVDSVYAILRLRDACVSSGHMQRIELKNLTLAAENPGNRLPISCPFKIEWSGSYVGNLATIFGMARSREKVIVAQKAEGSQDDADDYHGLNRGDGRDIELDLENEIEHIEHTFWDSLNRQISDPFIDIDQTRSDDDQDNDDNEEVDSPSKRPPEGHVTLRSIRPHDQERSRDDVLADIQDIFVAAATLLNVAGQKTPWVHGPEGCISLLAKFAHNHGRSTYDGALGVIAFSMICNHIIGAFNPTGWMNSSTTKTNRSSGYLKRQYTVASYNTRESISAHAAIAATKRLRSFLMTDCGITSHRADELIAGLQDDYSDDIIE